MSVVVVVVEGEDGASVDEGNSAAVTVEGVEFDNVATGVEGSVGRLAEPRAAPFEKSAPRRFFISRLGGEVITGGEETDSVARGVVTGSDTGDLMVSVFGSSEVAFCADGGSGAGEGGAVASGSGALRVVGFARISSSKS